MPNEFDDIAFTKYILRADATSVILKCHLTIEQNLDKIIKKVFLNADEILIFTFRNKLNVLNAMGYIPDDIMKDLITFNRIRNKVSHKFNYMLSEQDLADFKAMIKTSSISYEPDVLLNSLQQAYPNSAEAWSHFLDVSRAASYIIGVLIGYSRHRLNLTDANI